MLDLGVTVSMCYMKPVVPSYQRHCYYCIS